MTTQINTIKETKFKLRKINDDIKDKSFKIKIKNSDQNYIIINESTI